MDLPGLGLLRDVFAGPVWLAVWVAWLMLVNSASFLFLRRREGRWVAAAWVANVVLMSALHAVTGYSRLLGLSHVLLWTPLLAVLWRRRHEWWRAGGVYGIWLRTVFVTDAVSLLIDYVDVVRWLGGDRG